MGRLIQFIPHPVTTGFTAGIGTVIGVLQLKDLLGLAPTRSPDHFAERVHALWLARMRVLILNLSAVPAMDITGLVALESALLRLRQQGVLTLITGLRPQPESVLRKAGVQEERGRVQFCATLDEAAHAAAAHVSSASPALTG
ncbi:MAG TPA: STAS domain-containing protein [Myxococcales bacterium]